MAHMHNRSLRFAAEKFDHYELLHIQLKNIILNNICDSRKNNKDTVIGISGGFGYIPIHRMLREEILSKSIPVDHVTFFLTDDRHAPEEHPDANPHKYLLQDIPGVTFLCPRVDTLELDACIKDYNEQISKMLEKHGRVDLVALEMGEYGQIAGLYPPLDDSILSSDKYIVHTIVKYNPIPDRISISPSFLRDKCDKYLLLLKKDSRLLFWNELYKDVNDKTKMKGESFDPSVIKRWPVADLLLKKTMTVLFEESSHTMTSKS
jgi:6-phosphogluconolactonase/glucosamine-6-phosphate isomerase/deaminase